MNNLDTNFPENGDDYCLALFNQYLNYCQSSQDPLLIQLIGSTLSISFGQPGFPQQHAASLLVKIDFFFCEIDANAIYQGFSGPLEKLQSSDKLNIFQKYREYVRVLNLIYYYYYLQPSCFRYTIVCRTILQPFPQSFVAISMIHWFGFIYPCF